MARTADTPDGKPLYVQLRKGRWYWEPPLRLRRANGLESRALGADQTLAWAFARKLNREMAGLNPDNPAPGTVAWLFDQFFEGERFGTLAESTQGDYRWLAKRLGGLTLANTTLAKVQARSIRPRHADALYAMLRDASGHATAHYAARVARRVWKWAARRELVESHPNPWAGMELATIRQRHQRWTPEQVSALVAAAEAAKSSSVGLAVQLAYWLGHRQGDVLTLTWAQLDAGERETSKTKVVTPLVQDAYPEVDRLLTAERERQRQSAVPSLHVVVAEATKRPWNEHTFRHEFLRIKRLAGLPADLQFRDLRATAATELADSGADVIDMSTHTTHKDMASARRYARRTHDQFRHAAEKRLAGRKKPENG